MSSVLFLNFHSNCICMCALVIGGGWSLVWVWVFDYQNVKFNQCHYCQWLKWFHFVITFVWCTHCCCTITPLQSNEIDDYVEFELRSQMNEYLSSFLIFPKTSEFNIGARVATNGWKSFYSPPTDADANHLFVHSNTPATGRWTSVMRFWSVGYAWSHAVIWWSVCIQKRRSICTKPSSTQTSKQISR